VTQKTRPLYPVEGLRAGVGDAERAILDRWKERDIFHRTVHGREGAEPFVFYEGPPTANGKPGVHHVLARALKDIVCRYQTMRGRYVRRRGGWDTHGLPVELEVEKQLGITDKREIVEKYGIEAFNQKCRESVFTYLDDWRELTERIGYWVDLDDEYVTLKNEYIESVWALLKRIHEKGLVYRGFKSVPYSTKSGTTLSDHEVALGYQEVDDPSVTIRFRWAEDPEVSFLVWTTTPWTLPGNTGLAVHPYVDYVKVRHGGEVLVLAEDLLGAVLEGDEEPEILETMKGEALVGKSYVPLFDSYASVKETHPTAFTVVPGDFVTTTDGTGVVHQAPAFGAEDLEMAAAHGLPIVLHVDEAGCLKDEVADFAGLWFKDADAPITKDLKERGLLYKSATYRHTYPFNWRGKDPLMYVAREAWYVRTTDIRQRLCELNGEIRWVPEHIREGRFGNWLENNVDWALSRERFWGTPLPIWVSDRDASRFEVIGSVAELSERAGRDLSDLDLHRPYVDEITWDDGHGGTMRRVPEVLDVWFDSGAMPFAQWHYPFENREIAESQFPADYICEAIDQTRGWFYSLHAIAALVNDAPAYKSCLVTGHLLGSDGQKMSKSLGNTVSPWDALDIGGADALRWFLSVTNNPTNGMRFTEDGVREVSRKILDTLRNLYLFFAQYANLDDYRPDGDRVPVERRPLLDRWILSRLHSLVRTSTEQMDALTSWRAGRSIEQFCIEDLSNWYVRRSRDRFWAPGFEEDKRAAFDTLYECLHTVARLMAPFAPFLAERLWLGLTEAVEAEESVHLASWPDPEDTFADQELEKRMEAVRRVVRLGRAGRNRANVKTRQPLSRVRIVPPVGEKELGAFEAIALEELNVKEAEAIEPGTALAELHAKARFDVLGPRFGKDMKKVAAAIGALPADDVAQLERSGQHAVDVDGASHEIRREEVQVTHTDPEGWVLEREGGWSVALDLEIGEELRLEGFAREIVNKVQFMRRQADFGITDRIEVFFEGTDLLQEAITRHAELIRAETQADDIRPGRCDAEATGEWTINGEPAVLFLRRV
jgi:isoleucyl-tRNA synthetase